MKSRTNVLRRRALPLLLLGVLVTVGGCGAGTAESEKAGLRSALEDGISAHDERIMGEIEKQSAAWNRTSAKFANAYNAGAITRLQRSGAQYVRTLSRVQQGMYQRAITFENSEMRRVYLKVIENYRDKLDAINGIVDGIEELDVPVIRRNERALNRAGRRAQRLAADLRDELRPYFSGEELEAMLEERKRLATNVN